MFEKAGIDVAYGSPGPVSLRLRRSAACGTYSLDLVCISVLYAETEGDQGGMTSNINSRLLDARFDAGLSVAEADLLLGGGKGRVVGRIERGRRLPSLRTAIKLEIIYQRPIRYLLPELYEALTQEVHRFREARRASAPKGRKGYL